MSPLRLAFSIAVALVSGANALAQDVVTLHSVTLDANDDVTVVYSKNFATCAHMRFNNASCTQAGVLTHVQNIFCTSGTNVSVTVPSTAFVAGFGPGISVFMVHGNNGGVASPCVTVGCEGEYGAGCAGTAGIPVLGAISECPPAGGTCDLQITNGPPASLAVLGFGLTQGSFPLFGCNLLIANLLGTATVVFDNTGAGGLSLPLPPGSNGFTFTVQAYALDFGGPEGFSATNGLLVRVM